MDYTIDTCEYLLRRRSLADWRCPSCDNDDYDNRTGLRSSRGEFPEQLIARACHYVPLRLAVRERLQEAGSSNVLPHGQHRVSALVPTPHHHFPYRVLRTFAFIHTPASLYESHVVPESRFPLPPPRSRSLSGALRLSLFGASPAILLGALLPSADTPPYVDDDDDVAASSLSSLKRRYRKRFLARRPTLACRLADRLYHPRFRQCAVRESRITWSKS